MGVNPRLFSNVLEQNPTKTDLNMVPKHSSMDSLHIPFSRLSVRVLLAWTLFSIQAPDLGWAAPFSCRDSLVRAREWVLGRPSPKKSEVIIESPMITLLREHSLQDREVIRLFTRHAGEPILNQNYLQNITDSIRESFAPWFEGESKESFQRMLRIQHVILTMGLDGNHPYLSTSDSHALSPSSRGRFRYEMSSLFMSPYLHFQISEHFTPGSLPPAFRTYLEEEAPGRSYQVPIHAIPEPHQPEVQLTTLNVGPGSQDFLIRYRYPSNPVSKTYVEELASIMETLRQLPSDAPEEKLLHLLADYIQIFSAGLPFDRVNYSIAMAQVNYILMKHGLRGIENGELDLISVTVPTPVFRQVFSDAVRDAQLPKIER